MKKILFIIIITIFSVITTFAQSSSLPIPTGLSENNIDDISATLSWNNNSSAIGWIVSYNVSFSSEVIQEYTTTNSLQILNLVSGTQYNWKVCMIDNNNDTSQWSIIHSFFTLGFSSSCSNVSNLIIGDMSDNGLRLQWQSLNTDASYEIVYDEIGTNPDNTGLRYFTSNQEYVLNNLTNGNIYQLSVRKHCSSSLSNWSYIYAKYLNDNSIRELPILIDFEDSASNSNVGLISSPTNAWTIGNNYNGDNNLPGHSLYVSNDNGISNSFNNADSTISYAYIDFNVPQDAVSFYIDFKYKSSLISNSDGMKVYLTSNGSSLSLNSLPNDMYQVGSILYNNTNNLWKQEHIELPSAYTGSTRRIVFVWTNDASSINNSSSIAIDDIYLTARYCPIADSLKATNISSTSAIVSWNMANNQTSFNIEYKKTSDSLWTTISDVENNYLLYNLSPDTYYQFRVQSNCNDEQSFYSTIDSFKTNIIVSVPTNITYSVNYSNINLNWDNQTNINKWIVAFKKNDNSSLWNYDTSFTNSLTINNLNANTEYLVKIKAINSINDSSLWTSELLIKTLCSPINDFPYLVSSTINYNSNDGFNNLVSCWDTNSNNLISPAINLNSLSSALMRFDYTCNSSLNILVSNNSGQTYSSLQSLPSTNSFLSTTIDLTNYILDTNFRVYFSVIPFHNDSVSTFSLKNFEILSGCSVAQNVDIDSITNNFARISWTSGTNNSSWLLKLKDENNILLNSYTTTNTHYDFSSLDSASTYILVIYSYCNNNQGQDSTIAYFTTTGHNENNCQAPSNFITKWFQTKGDETLLCNWESPNNVNIWQVEYKNIYAINWKNVIVMITPTFAIRNLDIGDVYCVRVRSICAPGDTSNYTNIDTVTIGQSSLININDISALVSLYPNPTKGIININSNEMTISDAVLINSVGQKIMRWTTLPKQINLSSLKKGVYLLRGKINNKTFTKKIEVYF
jgi:hypothetical protein